MSTTTRRRRTLKATLARTLAGNLAIAAAVVGSWLVFSGTTPVTAAGEPYPEAGLDRVRQLIEKHDCWSGDEPPGVEEPRRAVVTLPGGRPRIMPADVGYGIWLYHEPGVLHAFCA
jgi:hypothetical protein